MVERTTGLDSTTLTVVYDKQGQDINSIDAADLAAGLDSLRQICLRANTIVHGEARDASLRVVATRPGSFDLILQLSVEVVGAMFPLVAVYGPSALTLKAILFGDRNNAGVLNHFKQRRGRRYIPTDNPDERTVVVHNDINVSITQAENSVLAGC